MNNWDKKFMKMASDISEWSKDKNRKVGAVIVDTDNNVLSIGYNGIPRGCNDDIPFRYERPEKYLYFEHAERNAIFAAARNGVKLKDSIIYINLFCCADCARAIIQSGIKKVVSPPPDLEHPIWGSHFKAAIEMLEEAKVEIKCI